VGVAIAVSAAVTAGELFAAFTHVVVAAVAHSLDARPMSRTVAGAHQLRAVIARVVSVTGAHKFVVLLMASSVSGTLVGADLARAVVLSPSSIANACHVLRTLTMVTARVVAGTVVALLALPAVCALAHTIVFAISVATAKSLGRFKSTMALVQGTVESHVSSITHTFVRGAIACAVSGAIRRAGVALAVGPRHVLVAEALVLAILVHSTDTLTAAVVWACRETGRSSVPSLADTAGSATVTMLTTVRRTCTLRAIVSRVPNVALALTTCRITDTMVGAHIWALSCLA